MEEFIIYLLKSSSLLILFYGSYRFLLYGDTTFQRNRIFLLGGIFISVILPLIYLYKQVVIPKIENENTPQLLDISFTPQVENSLNLWEIAAYAYFLISIFFLCRLALRLISMFLLLGKSKKIKKNNYQFIKIENSNLPFSFFKYIFFNAKNYSQQDTQFILEHEKVHARQYHSADVLCAHLLTCVFWFNPISWMYKKSILQNLEFLADGETAKTSVAQKDYQKALLRTSLGNIQPTLSNHFHSTFIKKRIIMLNKKQTSNNGFLKMSLVLPFLIAFLVLFNTKTEAKIIQTSQEKEQQPASDSTDAEKLSKLVNSKDAPLFIVNGVLTKDMQKINNISPQQIESLTVLKGTKATALYGERGGKNGVVLIVTKKEESQTKNNEKIKSNFRKSPQKSTRSMLINTQTHTVQFQDKPLYVINGEIQGEDFSQNDLEMNTISSINVLRGEAATKKYGEQGENGTVEITTKKEENAVNSTSISISGTGKTENKTLLYVVNGKVQPANFNKNKINSSAINSVNVLKGKAARAQYGTKAKNGVIEITTKGYAEKVNFGTIAKITATTTDTGLEKIKQLIAEETGGNFSYNRLKRDAAGNIIRIKTKIKAGSSSSSVNLSSDAPIETIWIGVRDSKAFVTSHKQE